MNDDQDNVLKQQQQHDVLSSYYVQGILVVTYCVQTGLRHKHLRS